MKKLKSWLKLSILIATIFSIPSIKVYANHSKSLKIDINFLSEYDVIDGKIKIDFKVREDINKSFSGIKKIAIYADNNIVYEKRFSSMKVYHKDEFEMDLTKIGSIKCIKIVAEDNSGKITNYYKKINIDKIKPDIKYSFNYIDPVIKNNKVYLKAKPLLKFSVSDDNLKEVIFNEKAVNKVVAIRLEDGYYSPYIIARDKFKNTAVVNIIQRFRANELIIDTLPPKIDIKVDSNRKISKDSVPIEIKISDANLDVYNLDKRIDWSIKGNEAYGTFLMKESGTFSIKANDLAGNISVYQSEKIIIDKEKPEIIIKKKNSKLSKVDTIFIEVFDENLDVINIELYDRYKNIINDKLIEYNKGKYKISCNDLEFGKYYFTVNSIDKAGNINTVNDEFVILKNNIDIKLLGNDLNGLSVSNISDIGIKCNHPHFIKNIVGIVKCGKDESEHRLNIENGLIKLNKEFFDKEGNYLISLYVEDEYGLKVRKIIDSFTLDKSPPIIVRENNMYVIEDRFGIKNIYYYINGTEIKVDYIPDVYKYKLNSENIALIKVEDFAGNIIEKKYITNKDNSKKVYDDSPYINIYILCYGSLYSINIFIWLLIIFRYKNLTKS